MGPEWEALAGWMRGRRVAALTGAGCSTESGIPDYRGPETRRRARDPIRFQQFVGDPSWRRRYWARSYVGWQRVAAARPNPGHEALAALERAGHLLGLVTQNVDGLHGAAGSRRVIELHGRLADVRCLGCGRVEARTDLQARLSALNPGWAGVAEGHAPDGDAELDASAYAGFHPADCAACGGALKPDVVFFGEGVPRERVEAARALVDEADGLLVIGTSLAVFSGLRFVRQAHAAGRPVAIVNLGETRGDPLASLRVEGRSGELLPRVAAALLGA
jgi:NAD-dependent SIR2 family protein deacetylase